MLRLDDAVPQHTISDTTLGTMRAFAAFATAAILALAGLGSLKIPEPERGLTQIYVDLEIPSVEQESYIDVPPPAELILDDLVAGSSEQPTDE
jgi:hypothetical protein